MTTTTVERQKKIVEILSLLHQGGSFEQAKQMFDQSFDGIDVSEITAAEKALISSGLDPSEIQSLCNVHAAVFKGAINDIHRSNYEHEQPGHPIHTLKLENQVIQSLLVDEIMWVFSKIETGDWSLRQRLLAALEDLQNINRHYTRKETLIFSYMEKYGITAPPKVMWGVDDSIREALKSVIDYLKNEKAAINPLREKLEYIQTEIEEMIFKEEEIMTPMTLDVFTLEDWEKIARDSQDIGYAFIAEPLPWKASAAARASEQEREPQRLAAVQQAQANTAAIKEGMEIKNESIHEENEQYFDWESTGSEANVVLPTGVLNLEELVSLFQVLPVDLTFVDKNDRVRFFSEGKNRVFPRTTSVIGREVINCHPPKSMHIVQQILDDFRAGKRTDADFWIDMRDRKIYIRYFALKNDQDEYLGCLEVTQDITDIQTISGQNRLLD
ncbi:hypothetical protein A5819_000247 [Enterococcus sp. 7E2_DIV0204]|uniref:DUF438 domain-containing protein n=1 Tax=unclassified Enterococcus TaxID=2608891 RepID=UPI000A336934|nr:MULTISPECIES: DUF438 domain-containing protein [unclassified Enterococcus]OTN87799.1 hypothetical protein A5819_000247 [Enterococcus sp. 7E2_DIV0204]OTP49519.1 hypothetical protein A5884_002717 [Enterococcus sp. 7D2_DIV0200]